MTDRELLELAAKAAGYPIKEWIGNTDCVEVAILQNGTLWQPLLKNKLTDCMGDALRLAVKLELVVYPPQPKTAQYKMACVQNHEATVFAGGDPYVATCRAIVRAAAEIGRSMK